MIRIIRGVYGHYTGGHVVPKDKMSNPFLLDPEQEARLVRSGVAVYVEEPNMKYSMETKVEDLRQIAKRMGLIFSVGTTKSEMIARMDAFKNGNTDDDTPKFDVAEAVR